ncbi:transcobalamin-2 [Astyanax mexicanus]|uniref:transcobalamin-2 n=1 Tax=Astyanax mexicanus TaxID=7994 RepID=UPI0020CB0977|nr:transcobalamin-2 [Astyanax mexicanus]
MALKLMFLLSVLLFAALMPPTAFTSDVESPYKISLVVYNSLTTAKNLTFSTDIAYRGILLGAMRKIAAKTNDFKFTIKDDLNYGPFLVSVNGVAGGDQTYWELLSKRANGTIIWPDVGVGCFIPDPDDTVILKYTTW